MRLLILGCSIVLGLSGCDGLSGEENGPGVLNDCAPQKIAEGTSSSPISQSTIIFAAEDDDGVNQFFVVRPDGSGLQQISEFGPSAQASYPSWRPTGAQIVFSGGSRTNTVGPDLWVFGVDGTPPKSLEGRFADRLRTMSGQFPQWNSSGTSVAYEFCSGCASSIRYDIYTWDPQTLNVTRITSGDPEKVGSNFEPTWSPDATQLAYVSNRAYLDSTHFGRRHDLYVANTDDAEPRRLTEIGSVRQPIWSPSGRTIVFASEEPEGLLQVDVESGEVCKLSAPFTNSTRSSPESWSADGQHLLISFRDPPNKYSLKIVDLVHQATATVVVRNERLFGADWYFGSMDLWSE